MNRLKIGVGCQLLILALAAVSPAWSATYYISKTLGSDSNTATQAQSKSTPWKHLPGMEGCTTGCTSNSPQNYTPKAGDNFILYGGDTWGSTDLGDVWIWSGNATTASPGCTGTGCIYIGVDPTWFMNITGTVNTSGTTVTWVSGVRAGGDLGYLVQGNTITINGTAFTVASVTSATSLTLTSSAGTQSAVSFSYSVWTRPIFNAQGAQVSTPYSLGNVLFYLAANYVTLDNIEFTGLFWQGTVAYGTGAHVAFKGGSTGFGTNCQIEHLYIHGWSHPTFASGTNDASCGIIGDTANPNLNANSIAHDNVIDGSDTDQQSCNGAFFGSPPYIQHNFVQYVASANIIDGTVLIDGNTIMHVPPSFQTGAHTNAIEINATNNAQISNNIIAHLGSGTLGIWCGPNATFTCEIFNNVMFDTDVSNVLDLSYPVTNSGCANSGSYCNAAGFVNLYNNTVECGPNSGPADVCAGAVAGMTGVTLENNHFITSASGFYSTGPTPTEATNLLQSLTTTNGQGYSESETYPFSPTAGTNSTAQAGTNLTSLCTGALTTLCQDTPLGVAYNPLNHTVSEPYRTPNPRPATGNWDIGAYYYTPTPASASSLGAKAY